MGLELGWMIAVNILFPAIVLCAAIVAGQRYRGRPLKEAKAALFLAASYPAWMFSWTMLVMLFGGMIGPCNTRDLDAMGLAFILGPPSVIFGLALTSVVESKWMLAAPLAGDAVMLGVSGLISSASGQPFAIERGWMAPWNAYVWLLVVVGIGAWCIVARRPRPGTCLACGYDLGGLAVDGACPECGKARAGAIDALGKAP